MRISAGPLSFNRRTAFVACLLFIVTGSVLFHAAFYSQTLHSVTQGDDSVQPIPTTRPESCDNCFPHDYKYIINNEHLCKSESGNPRVELLILVTSGADQRDERHAVRETWGSLATKSTNMRLAFLVGIHKNESYNEQLLKENEVEKDIIQEDFQDTYMNLTLKSVMGLKWAITYCDTTDYILKTDTDMFINLPNLMDLLKDSPLKMEIGGYAKPPERPLRDPTSKWYTPEHLYPNETFPWSFSGTGYVVPFGVAQNLIEISQHTPYFHLEDIYVALMANKIGVKITNLEGFDQVRTGGDATYYCGCVTTSHHFSPRQLHQLWESILMLPCHRKRQSIRAEYSCRYLYFKYIMWKVTIYGIVILLIINLPIYFVLRRMANHGRYLNEFHKVLFNKPPDLDIMMQPLSTQKK